MSEATVLHGRLARAHRTLNKTGDPADAARVEQLRRDYAAESLAEHIRQVVDSAPPLTAEQRTRLAGLLAPYAGDAA